MSEPQRATPMYLTAEQAEATSFEQVRKGGYSASQVEAFASRAAASISWLTAQVESLEKENSDLRFSLAQAGTDLEEGLNVLQADVESLSTALQNETLTADLATAAATDLYDRLEAEVASRPSASAAVEVVAMAHTTARATLDAANDKAAALIEAARADAESRRAALEGEMASQVSRLRDLAQAERELRAALSGVVEGVRERLSEDIMAGDAVVVEVKRHLEAHPQTKTTDQPLLAAQDL